MRAYGNVNRMAIISKENGETIRDSSNRPYNKNFSDNKAYRGRNSNLFTLKFLYYYSRKAMEGRYDTEKSQQIINSLTIHVFCLP